MLLNNSRFTHKFNFKPQNYNFTKHKVNTNLNSTSDLTKQAIYQINQQTSNEINPIKLADSLINLDCAKFYKADKKLKKQYKQQVIENYIDGALNYIPTDKINAKKGKIYENNRYENLSYSFQQAGKHSYAKGRGVTAGLHSITSGSNVIGSIIKVVSEASIVAFQTTIGLSLAYRFFGDLGMAYTRRSIKAYEEIHAQYGYPKISKNLEQGTNIAQAIKELQEIDFDKIIENLQFLTSEAQKITNTKDDKLKQKFFDKILEDYQHIINPAYLSINNLTAARRKEKIEWSGYKLTLAVNVLMGCLQISMSLVSDLSILFAAPISPFIKLGLSGASFISVLLQHAINHKISGKNLDKKFKQTIYSNLKAQNYFNAGYNIQDLTNLKAEYIQCQTKLNSTKQSNQNIINSFNLSSPNTHEQIKALYQAINNNLKFETDIKILEEQYINNINSIINTQSMQEWWQKPYQHRMRIAYEWVDAKIHKNLSQLSKLKQQQMLLQKDTQNTINITKSTQINDKICLLIKATQALFDDKQNLNSLLKKIKHKNQDLESNFNSFHNSEILQIFTDDKIAYKCNKFAKKNLENENMRYIYSYMAPSFLSTTLGSSLVGTILGENLINYSTNNPPIPLQSTLNMINHGQSLSTPYNNEAREAVKIESENQLKFKRENREINSYSTNIEPHKFLQQLKQDDNLIQQLMHSGDINFINEKQEIYLNIKAGRNKHKAKLNNLNTYSYKTKIFANMMIGGIRGPYLHYYKARKVKQQKKYKIVQLKKLTLQLEQSIKILEPDFYTKYQQYIYKD